MRGSPDDTQKDWRPIMGTSSTSDPDQGKNYQYLDPQLTATGTEQSYNTALPNTGSGSGSPQVVDSGVINVDLGSVREVELNLLSDTQQGVQQYTALRNAVMGAVGNQYFWGPTPYSADAQRYEILEDAPIAYPFTGDPNGGSDAIVQNELSKLGVQFG
jgi:hypothetical protein